MSLTIFDIQASAHSIEIQNAAGQALAIDGSGFITSNINGTVEIVDGGNSITVDGTVAATQSGVWDIGTVTTLTGITNDVNIADGGNSITIDDGGGSITVDGSVETTPGGFSAWKVTADTVATTEGELVATPLSGRLRVLIQNLSSNNIYVKEATGVTTANGMLIAKKNVFEADLDDGANIFAISDSGASNDIRIVEFAS